MIVVDTNVVAYLLLPSPHSGAVDHLRAGDPDWLAPRLWRYEFLNILWMHVRHDGLDARAAEELAAYALGPLGLVEQDPDPVAALSTACGEGLSAYDSQFVALARAVGVPLFTFDRQVLRRCGDVARRPPAP